MKIKNICLIIIVWMVSQSFLYGQADAIPSDVETLPSSPKHCGRNAEIVGIVVPSIMITYGFISLGNNKIRNIDYNVRNSLERNQAFWHTHVDDYLQFAPAVAAYTMKFCGMESRHNALNMTIIYGLSNLLAGRIVSLTKIATERERPDYSNKRSFPSGHTQTAFVAAEFLHQEFKEQSVWISIGGYSAATFVGFARVRNNRHWVSDVVAGAGIGILSTKFVYWTYPYLQNLFEKKDKSQQAFIFPGYDNGKMCLNFSYTF
jgi:hypothetical protein